MTESNNKLIWIAAISLVILSLGIIAARDQSASQVETDHAPDFSLTTFDGEQISLSDWRGNVVVVNFWASWCAPCRDEADMLERVWREYQSHGVQFVGVNYADNRANASAHIAEFDITYPNGTDEGKRISQAYGVRGVPETFIIDANGNLQDSFIGPPPEAQLRAAIESARR